VRKVTEITELSKKNAQKLLKAKLGSTNWDKRQRHSWTYKQVRNEEIEAIQAKMKEQLIKNMPRFLINYQLDEMGFFR
jgi:hypothetical protein